MVQDRETMINVAGAQYDAQSQSLKNLTSREAFINCELRGAGKKLLADGEAGRVESLSQSDRVQRRLIIANSASVWNSEPGLQRLTSKRAYVDDALARAHHSKINDAERDIAGL